MGCVRRLSHTVLARVALRRDDLRVEEACRPPEGEGVKPALPEAAATSAQWYAQCIGIGMGRDWIGRNLPFQVTPFA